MSVGQQLKIARAALGLDQKEFSALSGIPLDTYKKYEGGVRQPGSEAISGIARAGINANWLLIGEGPMLLKDLQPRSQPMKINIGALAATLDGATRGLPPGTSPRNIAEFAVKMYLDALEKGLITPDGIGEGVGEKSA